MADIAHPVQPIQSEAVGEADPIPYQSVKYARSDVKFVHLSLATYLEERRLKLGDQMRALVENMPAGTFIAGGSVAALVNPQPIPTGYLGPVLAPADIDLFFANPTAFEGAVKLLSFVYKEMTGPRVPDGVRMFQHPIAGYLDVQAINIAWFTDGIEAVLDGFDFTATHFGIDVLAKELVFNPVAPLDYGHRRLLNHRFEGDEASKRRIAKYLAKGFHPVGATLQRAKECGIALAGAAL